MSLRLLNFLARPAVLNAPDAAALRPGAAAGAPHPAVPPADPPADRLADPSADLRARIQDVYVAHVTAAGVDYGALAASPAFAAYKRAAALLAPPSTPTPATDAGRTAFFVNLYNALTIHAFAALGPPAENSLARLLFNARASYTVAGHTLSLSDLENGILRRNQGVAIWPPPFRAGDARLALCVTRVDPRIHFVLNCGAQSCPPIRFLTADSIEDDLNLATRAFLARRDNFSVGVTEMGPAGAGPRYDADTAAVTAVTADVAAAGGVAVTLSAIFRWYRVDFAGEKGGEAAVLRFIADHAAEGCVHAEALRRVLRAGDDVVDALTVRYAPYDWSLNAYKGVV